MNIEILLLFVILTIMHPIADFLTPYRKWGKSWKQFFLSEWFLAINPMHWLWDALSPLRKHPKYMRGIDMVNRAYADVVMGINDTPNNYKWIARPSKVNPTHFTITNKFWRWLAIDQVYHVLSNVLFSYYVGQLL